MPEAGENVVDNTKETVNTVNLKSVGENGAITVGLAQQGMVDHLNGMRQIREMFLGSLARAFVEVTPIESSAITPLLQQALKGAQSSQPETGGTPS